MSHRERATELVYAWIHDHAPLSVKMNVMPAQSDKLIEAVASAIRDAERAAYERAADCQPCTAENPNEDAYQRGRFDGVMEFSRAILALIDQKGG